MRRRKIKEVEPFELDAGDEPQAVHRRQNRSITVAKPVTNPLDVLLPDTLGPGLLGRHDKPLE
jgi:hypothetical protein